MSFVTLVTHSSGELEGSQALPSERVWPSSCALPCRVRWAVSLLSWMLGHQFVSRDSERRRPAPPRQCRGGRPHAQTGLWGAPGDTAGGFCYQQPPCFCPEQLACLLVHGQCDPVQRWFLVLFEGSKVQAETVTTQGLWCEILGSIPPLGLILLRFYFFLLGFARFSIGCICFICAFKDTSSPHGEIHPSMLLPRKYNVF